MPAENAPKWMTGVPDDHLRNARCLIEVVQTSQQADVDNKISEDYTWGVYLALEVAKDLIEFEEREWERRRDETTQIPATQTKGRR